MDRKNKLPSISVVITTYNEEKRLGKCLDSVAKQHYPKSKLEIVIVDDNSNDNTILIAKRYTKKIYYSGKRFCEISRAIGILKANHNLILLLDADNILPRKDFLLRAVEPFLSEKGLVGSYPFKFHYSHHDPASNRYCSLFGINEPFQYYSKAREHLSFFETSWTLLGNVQNHKNYFLVDFPKDSLLTLGAIGFLGQKSYMVKQIKDGLFLHSDAFNTLIRQGHNKFAAVKQTIIHNHCSSSRQFFAKLARNFTNYLNHSQKRKNIWATSNRSLFVLNVLTMSSVIIPLVDSIKGFFKRTDLAWFLHPFYCLGVIILYSYMTISYKLRYYVEKGFGGY